MRIALPLQDSNLASHFTKASYFAIYDEFGDLITQFDNPAIESGCSGKHQLVERFTEYKVATILVKNIGERMLGKLLENGINIKQVNQRNQAISELLNQLAHYPVLSERSQGRPSIQYQAKQSQGECCSHTASSSCHRQSCEAHHHQGKHGCDHH
ncbi:NifB/NifX family molybdenum-iron cluster-binding protein [Vibrio olivae]|uniref:NifB/NifX family molybdenum-iron cluster-binding protein n=1 Tax=Vibrio olivae TaxID=1243002 RepID=A0ABV5HK99_9VIBR